MMPLRRYDIDPARVDSHCLRPRTAAAVMTVSASVLITVSAEQSARIASLSALARETPVAVCCRLVPHGSADSSPGWVTDARDHDGDGAYHDEKAHGTSAPQRSARRAGGMTPRCRWMTQNAQHRTTDKTVASGRADRHMGAPLASDDGRTVRADLCGPTLREERVIARRYRVPARRGLPTDGWSG